MIKWNAQKSYFNPRSISKIMQIGKKKNSYAIQNDRWQKFKSVEIFSLSCHKFVTQMTQYEGIIMAYPERVALNNARDSLLAYTIYVHMYVQMYGFWLLPERNQSLCLPYVGSNRFRTRCTGRFYFCFFHLRRLLFSPRPRHFSHGNVC